MTNKEQFVALSRKLVLGLLREAIGYSVESEIPYFQGTVGYMVEAPLLWIRHSRFPILFVAYDQHRSDTLETVGKQLQIAKAIEFFALLVVVPTAEGTGREAQELRRLVADSVYRYDFVVLDRQSLASIIAHNSSQHLVEIILEQGIELSSLSPYVVKGPVSEKMFFGREKEIKTVTQGIQRGSDYAIVGGRRIGKSSTLQRVNRLLNNDPRYQPLYMDCEEKFNYDDLFQALADEFGEPLEGTDPLGFRKLVTKLEIQAPARQIVFLLDEVDALLAFDAESKPAGQLFRTFRALSHEGLCRFVFSGSRTLYRHLHNPHSPFFNFCEDIVLKPLEQKSIVEIVSKPMHQLGIELLEEEVLIDRIIDLSSSHPNIAQWLCDRLIKTASTRRITLNNLEDISADPEFCRHYVETAWGDSTPLEKIISLAVEGPSFEIEKLCEVLANHGFTDETMIRESVEMLQLCALFEREGQRYRFALTHFPHMVRKMVDVTSLIEWLLGQVVV
jgi:Cdc6-like AAA superfamily ATPase